MAKTVTLSTDSRGIARITIARPERKNAFDAALIAELGQLGTPFVEEQGLLRIDATGARVTVNGQPE